MQTVSVKPTLSCFRVRKGTLHDVTSYYFFLLKGPDELSFMTTHLSFYRVKNRRYMHFCHFSEASSFAGRVPALVARHVGVDIWNATSVGTWEAGVGSWSSTPKSVFSPSFIGQFGSAELMFEEMWSTVCCVFVLSIIFSREV